MVPTDMTQPVSKRMTAAEFVAWEDRQEGKHEYENGVICAKPASTVDHDVVRVALLASLVHQLRGKPCRAHIDLKAVCGNGNVRYPDAAISCSPRDGKRTTLENVKVVCEVLSTSTQSTDYLIKTVDYGSIPSVTHYLIFSQSEPRVDIIARGDGGWGLQGSVDGLAAVIDLPDLGVKLSLNDIYAEIGEGA